MQRLDPLPANSRARSAIELALVVTLAEIWIWNLYGAGRGVFPVLASVVIGFIVITASIRRYRTPGDDRQRLWSAARSWLVVLFLSIAFTLAVFVLGELLLFEGERFRFTELERVFELDWISRKLPLIVMQQMLLHLFFFPSFLDIVAHRWTARLLTAALFGILHLPSLLLAGLTGFVAVIWSWYYEKTKRLVPLFVCHLVLAIAVATAFSERLVYNLGVGESAMERVQRYTMVTQERFAPRFFELQSDAFYARNGGNDEDFIRALYREMLKREAPEEAVKAWAPRLRYESRAALVSFFFTSEEFQQMSCQQQETC